MTPKEFQLAMILFNNLARPLSREYLLRRVWGQRPDLETRTLDAHVSRLRSKLHLRPANGFRLTTVYGFGYRLEACDPRGRPTRTPKPERPKHDRARPDFFWRGSPGGRLAWLAAQNRRGAAPPDAPVAYVVKPGDTLIGLGRAYLTKPSDYRRCRRPTRSPGRAA
jgi:hypothetical protein